MSADHKSSTEDPAQAHVALALVLGDIFYFFFFFFLLENEPLGE